MSHPLLQVNDEGDGTTELVFDNGVDKVVRVAIPTAQKETLLLAPWDEIVGYFTARIRPRTARDTFQRGKQARGVGIPL